MADYRPEVIKLLRAAGCYFKRRAKGDHDLWFSPITKRSFPVDGEIKSRHTANGIMKQAGINHRF